MALTKIGEILERTDSQRTPTNSSRQTGEENEETVFITAREAREQGIPFRTAPPENSNCPFCGKLLEPQGIVMMGSVMFWQPFPPRCDCKQAAAHWETYDREQKEKWALEEETKRRKVLQEKVEQLLGKSGIKKRFMQRTFPNFIIDTPGRQKNYQIAKEYADNFSSHQKRGDGLYIEGTNGTGKTHLAAAIALQLIGEGIPVICKASSDLLLDIRKTFNSSEGASEGQILDIYKRVDLLIIDDLGKEQCTDWGMSTLYSILNDRYEDMKPTIITTNYNTENLIKALTPKGMDGSKIIAIISRLQETSTVMTMAWEDIRGKEKTQI